MDLHTPYSRVSLRMTLSDLEWLSEIFNDTKHRAVCLQQLSFLYVCVDVTYSITSKPLGCVFIAIFNDIERRQHRGCTRFGTRRLSRQTDDNHCLWRDLKDLVNILFATRTTTVRTPCCNLRRHFASSSTKLAVSRLPGAIIHARMLVAIYNPRSKWLRNDVRTCPHET